jgi:Coenzyme PQQ synthesis protein D (PqqD)
MNFYKRRRILKKANLLELTPVRLHEHENEENGQVILLVQKFKNKEVGRFMLGHRSAYFRIRLDEMGSAVWTLIDGKTNVNNLITNLSDNWKETPEKTDHLEERLAAFISQLYDNRYISFRELEEPK